MALLLVLLIVLLTFLLALELLLQLGCSPIVGPTGNTTSLQGTTVEAWTIVIMATSDDFAAAYDNGTMAVVKGRLGSLLQAQRQVVVGVKSTVEAVLLAGVECEL